VLRKTAGNYTRCGLKILPPPVSRQGQAEMRWRLEQAAEEVDDPADDGAEQRNVRQEVEDAVKHGTSPFVCILPFGTSIGYTAKVKQRLTNPSDLKKL